MAAWIQCPACLLKHSARPDGKCPKCRFPLAPPTSGAPAPAPAVAVPLPATVAPSSSWDRPRPPPAPAAWVAPRELTVGSLFTGTFSAWFGTAGAVLPLLTFLALPSAWAAYEMIRSVSMLGESISPFLWFVLVLFLSQPPAMVIAARAATRHAARAPVELGDLLGEAWRTYLPVLVISVILDVAWGGASVINRRVPLAGLVSIPALLFLFTVWTVSVPALVAERVGPIAALGRSWELTRGHRWKIFGAFVLITICVGVVALGVYFGLTWALVKAYGPRHSLGESRSLLAWVLASYVVIVTLAGSVLSAATGVAYHLLRGRTEEAELRRVFA